MAWLISSKDKPYMFEFTSCKTPSPSTWMTDVIGVSCWHDTNRAKNAMQKMYLVIVFFLNLIYSIISLSGDKDNGKRRIEKRNWERKKKEMEKSNLILGKMWKRLLKIFVSLRLRNVKVTSDASYLNS